MSLTGIRFKRAGNSSSFELLIICLLLLTTIKRKGKFMISLLLLAVLSHPLLSSIPATSNKAEIKPAPVIVNTATIEYKNEKGETFKVNSNTVKTTIVETIALNVQR